MSHYVRSSALVQDKQQFGASNVTTLCTVQTLVQDKQQVGASNVTTLLYSADLSSTVSGIKCHNFMYSADPCSR